MHTQRWQFNQNKWIGMRTLLPVSVVLIAITSLPATAQVIRTERTVFGTVEQVPDNSQIIYSDQVSGFRSGYVNPGYYPSPVIRRNFPLQQPVIVAPPNGIYQAPGGNTVIYKNPFPGSTFGSVNPGYYANPNYYPYPIPLNRRNQPLSNPVLVNPTIRNSTLINPVIITPRSRWQREDRFRQPARY